MNEPVDLNREKQKKKILDQLAEMRKEAFTPKRRTPSEIKDLKTEAYFKAKDRI